MIYLSFDIEEFDMPKEYGYDIEFQRQIAISRQGLISILDVLKKHNISARDFKDSYNYYVNDTKSLNEIYDNAKKIILEKDPKMKEYLKKKKE